MQIVLPILFATIAAIGNAIFAFGQKQAAGAINGLAFVGASALVATLMSLAAALLTGGGDIIPTLRSNGRAIITGGAGLFLTYVGFYLLYSRFGATHYVLYAALSILTTTVVVGMVILRESINLYHAIAIVLAVAAVIMFSVGQARN